MEKVFKLFSEIKEVCAKNPQLTQMANEGINKLLMKLNSPVPLANNNNNMLQMNMIPRPDAIQPNQAFTAGLPQAPTNFSLNKDFNFGDKNQNIKYDDFKEMMRLLTSSGSSLPVPGATEVYQFLSHWCNENPNLINYVRKYVEDNPNDQMMSQGDPQITNQVIQNLTENFNLKTD